MRVRLFYMTDFFVAVEITQTVEMLSYISLLLWAVCLAEGFEDRRYIFVKGYATCNGVPIRERSMALIRKIVDRTAASAVARTKVIAETTTDVNGHYDMSGVSPACNGDCERYQVTHLIELHHACGPLSQVRAIEEGHLLILRHSQSSVLRLL